MNASPEEYIDIIIPVYNEGENIIHLLQAFEDKVQTSIRILICYDQDDDNTLAAIKVFKSRFQIRLIKMRENLLMAQL
ncbi:glycosyltransferase [Candidatus Villigracilis affinis]|uniref:glycosyltransferase n=1 Tax=Candidatus Villigracilis affinis TaxID=3140682 RepID=UPI002A1CE9A9|nr:glycosyltransferase [Anaerolineales bacterium]